MLDTDERHLMWYCRPDQQHLGPSAFGIESYYLGCAWIESQIIGLSMVQTSSKSVVNNNFIRGGRTCEDREGKRNAFVTGLGQNCV
jgi:hypothetical protein